MGSRDELETVIGDVVRLARAVALLAAVAEHREPLFPDTQTRKDVDRARRIAERVVDGYDPLGEVQDEIADDPEPEKPAHVCSNYCGTPDGIGSCPRTVRVEFSYHRPAPKCDGSGWLAVPTFENEWRCPGCGECKPAPPEAP